MNYSHIPIYEGVLNETSKSLQTIKPVEYDSYRMKSKVRDEELIRGCSVEKRTHLRGSSLIEKPLQPDVGIHKIQGLIASPFESFFLKLQRSVLVAVLS